MKQIGLEPMKVLLHWLVVYSKVAIFVSVDDDSVPPLTVFFRHPHQGSTGWLEPKARARASLRANFAAERTRTYKPPLHSHPQRQPKRTSMAGHQAESLFSRPTSHQPDFSTTSASKPDVRVTACRPSRLYETFACDLSSNGTMIRPSQPSLLSRSHSPPIPNGPPSADPPPTLCRQLQSPRKWSKSENVRMEDGHPRPRLVFTDRQRQERLLTTVTTDGKAKQPQTGVDYSNDYVAELQKQA